MFHRKFDKGDFPLYINQIQTGTQVVVTVNGNMEIETIFDGNIDHIRFNIISPDIYKNVEAFVHTKPVCSLVHEGKPYSFTMDVLKKGNQNIVECKMTSPFKEVTQREDLRLSIAFKVRILEHAPHEKSLSLGKFICEGLTFNVSKKGVRIFADHPIDAAIETYFTLDFSFAPHGSIYYVPAKLMRNQPNTATRSYRYDYGFVFDFSQHPAEQEKLMTEIFELKLRGVY